MENLTTEQALEVVRQGLSHDSLKLSQREHIILMQSFDKLKELVEKEKNDTSRDKR